jgi:hypothetical protein
LKAQKSVYEESGTVPQKLNWQIVAAAAKVRDQEKALEDMAILLEYVVSRYPK